MGATRYGTYSTHFLSTLRTYTFSTYNTRSIHFVCDVKQKKKGKKGEKIYFQKIAAGAGCRAQVAALDRWIRHNAKHTVTKKRTIAISFISSEPDQEVFDKVQSRFEVDIPELPDEIDMSSYMSTY